MPERAFLFLFGVLGVLTGLFAGCSTDSSEQGRGEPAATDTGDEESFPDEKDSRDVESDTSIDTRDTGSEPECEENASRTVDEPCGYNGNGKTIQKCVKGRWKNAKDKPKTPKNEACDDPDACPNGFTQFQSCEEGAGTQGRICIHGQFAEWGECIVMEQGWDYSEDMIGWAEGRFSFLQWLALDGRGNIFVTEPAVRVIPKLGVEEGANRAQVFTLDAEHLFTFARGDAPAGERYEDFQWNQNLEGIAIDRDAGIVYIADGYEEVNEGGKNDKIGNQRILKFDLDGEFIGLWGDNVSVGEDAHLEKPTDLALDAEGNLYVVDSDPYGPNVKKFDAHGNLRTEWAEGGVLRGNGDGDFTGISGIGFDADGNLYVANTHFCSIDKFDPEGKETLLRFGMIETCAIDKYREWFPTDVAVDARGDIYVSLDGYAKAVQKWSAEGEFLTEIEQVVGEPGDRHANSFYVPRGLIIEGERLYVADGARGLFIFDIAP